MSNVCDAVDRVARIIVRDAVWYVVGSRGAVCTDVEDIVRPVGDVIENAVWFAVSVAVDDIMKDLTR